MAAANFRALKTVKSKSLTVNGLQVKLQYNPCRVASTTAETDEKSIAARKCFLCADTRPKEQFHIKFNGRKNRKYNIQVNPFPIFQNHLVIARHEHIPQAIWHHMPDMLDFCRKYNDYTVFYNGPKSGASAPDHLHFQAIPTGQLPLCQAIDAYLDAPERAIAINKDASLYHYKHYTTGVFALKAHTSKSLTKLFYRLLCCCEAEEMIDEPAFNLYCYFKDGEYRATVVMRGAIRSHHYYAQGDEQICISPGAADMAGVYVAPFEKDFNKVTATDLQEMLSEVSISQAQEQKIINRLCRRAPKIDIGIVSGKEIVFEIISDGAGPQKVSWCDGRINYNGSLYDELYFDAVTRSTLFAEASFIIEDVTIGIGFHWERKRRLKYAGTLRFIVEGDKITAVNRIRLEDYLLSVISSEMKASAPLELLKAHAVISRSWVIARMRERAKALKSGDTQGLQHIHYDVCADDHCQRYQGVSMTVGDDCRRAIDQSWGMLLSYQGELCDTRYSKCCGGKSEKYSTCWEDTDFPYLQSVEDSFCNCSDDSILSTILNDYDLETKDFHDWSYTISREELSKIFERKTGHKIGKIASIKALKRGDSGRICSLEVTGENGKVTIEKELAIRLALSEDCLKSSAFDYHWESDKLVLSGKGWGHGVGLCQIGAAVMAAKGYDFREILSHYYLHTELIDISDKYEI